MPSSGLRGILAGIGIIGLVVGGAGRPAILTAQSDLDAFMQQVVARRDDNWKKLQQYVLDEREVLDLRGPGNIRMWGEERDYTWFIRDGFFIRSPLTFNGVKISEDERRKAEDEYLRRAQRRDQRAATREATGTPAPEAVATGGDDTLTNVDGLIRQTRQPEFVSSAYFLRFKFDAGTYALVGREQFEGRDVLRVEYYPTNLYGGRQDGRGRRGGRNSDPNSPQNRQEAELRRVMNKVALITLWIEPESHQIVKYTFDNINFDFLPGQWLVHVDRAKASMTMSQPFKDVWLPRDVDMFIKAMLALGPIDLHYRLDYSDYQQATTSGRIIRGGAF